MHDDEQPLFDRELDLRTRHPAGEHRRRRTSWSTAGEGQRTANVIVRGMKSLPVAFDPVA